MATLMMAPVCVGKTDFPLKFSQAHPAGTLALRPPQEVGTFRLLDGPPYANGPLHLGHVFNKSLKDLLVRAQAMQGRTVTWTPRWDCHGLPVELNVERAGTSRHDPLNFVRAARDYAQSQLEGQRATFKTLGVCASWDQTTPTMAPDQQAATLRVLADLVERQALVMRHQPGPWCPVCRSTVAGAEQEPMAVKRTEAVVPFWLEEGGALLSWTTTPWTLPYHAGLVVNPEATYVQVALDAATRVWVSDLAWPQVHTWYPESTLTDNTCLGQTLVGKTYHGPAGHVHAVVADRRVAAAAGTGVLHAVPAFDPFDADVGRTHQWPMVNAVAEDGTLTGPDAWGEHHGAKAGEKASVMTLAAWEQAQTVDQNWRVFQTDLEVAGCWRHRVPVLTRPSRQAFLSLTPEVRLRAEGMVTQMSFSPTTAGGRLSTYMAQRPDWCVSRQRTWGVPMALFLDRVTGQPHFQAPAVMRRVADAVAKKGVEAWWETDHSVWLNGLADEADVECVEDVLDVWFDSGALGVLAGQADAVVEGHDQLRGWFQACVWLAALMDAPAPFSHVVTHGFVVDDQGRKLSKSTGGDRGSKVPSWATLPSDVVRLWAAMGEVGADRPWSAATVTAAQAGYAKLRGTLRFALANVPPSSWGTTKNTEGWSDLDQQDVLAALQVRTLALEDLAHGHYEPAVRRVLQWADTGLSRHLYGRLKDRLYCAPAGSVAHQAAVEALKAAAGVLVDLLEVLTPQLVAEAYAAMPELKTRQSVHDVDLPGRPWSEAELAVRQALTAAWEPQGWKGGMDRARLTLDASLPWPTWAVEEALAVGQWQTGRTPDAVAVETPWGTAWLGPSPDPTCARCRRPGAAVPDTTLCPVCVRASEGHLNWR